MKINFLVPALICIILFLSCENSTQTASADSPKTETGKPGLLNQHLLQVTLWFEHAGEMKALYYQAYNCAKISLDKKLAEWNKIPLKKRKAHAAVIVDMDETVLDNSPFEGKLISDNLGYSDSLWKEWVNRSQAKALPGAVEFLSYAAGKGVEVFYISNRKTNLEVPTLKNLKADGFPFTDDQSHLLFLTNESSKQIRRDSVASHCDILLLCGDNLADLSSAFDDRTGSDRLDSVEKYKRYFGDGFIVLPNPMYGDWEKIFWGKTKLNDTQRDSARKANVIAY